MKIRAKYVNQLVSVLTEFVSINYDCSCLKTDECPCSECRIAIDRANKLIDELTEKRIIGDDLKVIKPKPKQGRAVIE